ncbi:MAG: hypothetical protein KAI66_09650 [Lentisphaeria bacterium]|nr:hypothetical protein [Lentisphaeria bacterium]
MKALLFQPSYPATSTAAAALECVQWMVDRLEALQPGDADLVLLPEYANMPGLDDPAVAIPFAQNEGIRVVEAAAQTAQRLGCLVALSVLDTSAHQRRNVTRVFGAEGDVAAEYAKVHLPAAERETLGIEAGGAPVVVDLAGMRVGFATCFDLYFPEFFEALAMRSPQIILCPSYQRSESAERIRLVSACRALDAGVYLLRASYSMGTEEIGGHSLVASPCGEILTDAAGRVGVAEVEFDPSERFVKPASHGQAPVEHRALIESFRRPGLYRPAPDRECALLETSFPRICAHRGLSEVCPENTIPAFAAALALPGVHEIELDLWLSRDGVPVVCHDPRLDRTTDGAGVVTELDWETIASFDAGMRLGEGWRGVRVPRFEEVLDLVEARVSINIHIKDPGVNGKLVRLVAELLRERGMTRLGYIAGDEDVLAAAREFAPEVDRCCLAHQLDTPRLIDTAIRYGCTRLQFFRNMQHEHAERAAQEGLVRNLFYSDEVAEARDYVALGVDVVLTNRAHQLAGRLADA